jgi:hypothetical protein
VVLEEFHFSGNRVNQDSEIFSEGHAAQVFSGRQLREVLAFVPAAEGGWTMSPAPYANRRARSSEAGIRLDFDVGKGPNQG